MQSKYVSIVAITAVFAISVALTVGAGFIDRRMHTPIIQEETQNTNEIASDSKAEEETNKKPAPSDEETTRRLTHIGNSYLDLIDQILHGNNNSGNGKYETVFNKNNVGTDHKYETDDILSLEGIIDSTIYESEDGSETKSPENTTGSNDSETKVPLEESKEETTKGNNADETNKKPESSKKEEATKSPETTKAPETTKKKDPVKNPETTKKQEESKKPETTKAPETTKREDTTSKPETTAPVVTTTPPVVSQPESDDETTLNDSPTEETSIDSDDTTVVDESRETESDEEESGSDEPVDNSQAEVTR